LERGDNSAVGRGRAVYENHQLDVTVSPVYYPGVYLQLNTFRGVFTPVIRSSTNAVAASGFNLERGDNSAVGRGRAVYENHQLDTTVSLVYYPGVYLQLNIFRASSRPSSGAQLH
jgi:hypothetical protein